MTNTTKQDLHWYAYRIFHNKIKHVKELLDTDHIEYFVPIRLTPKEQDEGFTYIETPIIPSLLFIRCTEDYLTTLRERFQAHLGIYKVPGTNHAAIIPDHEMDIFIYVLSKGCKQLETIDEKLVKGTHVRITGGLFEGAEGYITRVHGTKRFVVLIKGIAAVATTFVPQCYIEKLD